MTALPHSERSDSVAEAAKVGYAAPRSPLQSDDGRSVGSVLGDITANISTLLQQELALAKAEVRQSGTRLLVSGRPTGWSPRAPTAVSPSARTWPGPTASGTRRGCSR